jgi:hypothetical protein
LPTFPDPEGILKDDPQFYHQLDDVVQQGAATVTATLFPFLNCGLPLADQSYTVLERILIATSSLADATERYRQAIRATSAVRPLFRLRNVGVTLWLAGLARGCTTLQSC